MKILWTTNVLIGDACDVLERSHPASGSWMEALLEDFKINKENELLIITTERRTDIFYYKKDNVEYIVLPCGSMSEFKINNKNKKLIKKILKDRKIDIINIWGTESEFGLAILNEKPSIPSVVYIQGLMKTIAKYYEAGLTNKELIKAISFRDVIKLDWIKRQKKKFKQKSIHEKKIIKKSKNIISENSWCDAHCKAIDKNVNIHYCSLSVKKEFFEKKWEYLENNKKTIMCNASGYPIKGLHILLKAIAIVKIKYPEIKLIIPGEFSINQITIKDKLRQSGYSIFIKKLIKNLELEKNVEFIGKQSSSQMVEKLLKSNVFVMPSAIENHSSSLKEAMAIGTPTISSDVGGISEYVDNFKNGINYRFEEYELLAEYICLVLENKELSIKISNNSRLKILEKHSSQDIYTNINKIYKKIYNDFIKNKI